MAASPISASSSPSSRKIYDVFLNYYGLGSRNNFVDSLLHSLGRKGISTIMEDISVTGGKYSYIKQELFESMEQSSMVVIVVCKSYVSTPHCLGVLVKIMEFSKVIGGGLRVLPVFYDLDPLEVRKPKGISFWEDYWEIHKNSRLYDGYSTEKAKLWRQALVEVANLDGLRLKLKNIPNWDVLDFIEEIVETVMSNLGQMNSSCIDGNIIELVKHQKQTARSFLKIEPEESASNSTMATLFSSPSYFEVQSLSWTYDVFLSFRGKDTRKNFVDHLYSALEESGIYTFKDNEKLERGKSIAPALLKAIEESAIAVVIFSKNYAASSWCLDELVKIMSCHKTRRQMVFPVFYDVDPSDVRKQQGCFGEGFAEHCKTDRVKVWREVLVEAANLSGWDLKTIANGHEAKCVKDIVKKIQRELGHITSITVDDNLIGLESRIEDLKSLLDGPDSVCMIGVWGMGGAGKTTLARAVFDEISYHFDGQSFLENIREVSQKYGLQHVQKLLLEDVLMEENLKVRSVLDGKRMIMKRLCRKKVLLVLDDVDNLYQLETLVGAVNWFGEGSRIIITTRDEHILVGHGIKEKKIYKISLLNENEANQLFNRYAFKVSIPTKEYEEASQQVVCYAAGLPLTLKVLGSFLCGKTLSEWTSALDKLQKIPEKRTLAILEISYDDLDDEYKEAFLHIACFFKGWEKDTVFRILDSCEFYPHIVARVLEQKSLITISNDRMWMHDLIQEMGKDIVRRMQPDELGRRSRLWEPHEIADVLKENLGTGEIKAIVAGNLHDVDSMDNSEAFRRMTKLRLLYFHAITKGMAPQAPAYLPNELRWVTWHYYNLESLPESFHANKLVGLEMHHSKVIQLWNRSEVKVLHKLKFLDLSYSKKLIETPDFNSIPNLERLSLGFCSHLLEVHNSIGVLQRLVYLSLSGCSKLKCFPESLGNLVSLSELNLAHCGIQELPPSIGNLSNLVHLNLTYCQNLKSLPSTISKLNCLRTLDLHHCLSLREFPENLDCLEYLENLLASSTGVRHLPEAVSRLKCLLTLDLHHCLSLQMPLNLGAICFEVGVQQNLVYLNLSSCIQLNEFPESLGNLVSLSELDLSHNIVEELPSSIGDLTRLVHLNLTYCQNLKRLPISISGLKNLKTLQLHGCFNLQYLPDNLNHLESLENLILSNTSIRCLPNSISRCKCLRTLNVHDCRSLMYLPPALGDMDCLEVLRASRSSVMVIPDSICNSRSLKILDLRDCSNLRELPTYLSNIESLEEIYISGTRITQLPRSIDKKEELY